MTKYTPPANIEEAIEECGKVINKVLSKFTRNHYQDRNDLLQTAYEAVCIAYGKYDRKCKNRFSTYAYFWVWACVKEQAVGNWQRYNTSNEYLSENHDEVYVDEFKEVDVSRQIEKKEEKFQTVFSMRQAGMTFDEIAHKTGFKSLHQCRNYYMDQVADLEM